MRSFFLVFLMVLAIGAAPARAQFDEAQDTLGPRKGQTFTNRFKIGIVVKAKGGPCANIVGTVPIPTEWPEQRVRIIDETDVTPNVKSVDYNDLGRGTVRQMRIFIPKLASGETARAVVTFEVSRSILLPPDDTSQFTLVKKPSREMNVYLKPSKLIEVNNPKIKALAKELGADLDGWEKIEALYDGVRGRVNYVHGPIKGALKALHDGTGDCEELTSLFVAVCRANGIPARIVWVEGQSAFQTGHCYPEFYVLDEQGQGVWLPCQAAGTRAFGGIPEERPIFQKGDNFRDPDRPSEQLRYVNAFLKGAAIKGGGDPKVTFIMTPVSSAEPAE